MLNEVIYKPLNIALFLFLNLLNVLIGNKIIIKLLVQSNYNKDDIMKSAKITEIKLLIIQVFITTMTKFLIPFNYYKIFNLIVDLVLYSKLLKLKSEKLLVAEIINLIISTFSESIIIFNLNLPITNINLIGILELITKIIIYMMIKFNKIKLDIKESVNDKEKLRISLISLSSIFCVIFSEIRIMKDIDKINIYIYFIINFIIISYLIILMKWILLELWKANAIEEIENLEGCNKRLQENYDDVRAFKHDFNNIMQGMGGYIEANDIDGLKKMYKSISKECQQINDKQSINENVINNPAILNLINNKIKLAEKRGIEFKVQVYVDLNSLNVSIYDLCRMLGILLDNAIEACSGCEEKTVTIKFLKDKYNNRNLIVIENPCKNYLIDVKKIYEKGVSSKNDKISHGLGLWKVKQILKKNKNIQIYTSRDKLFKQQLEIY